MNILHVSPMYFPALGGAEYHLKAISEGLAGRGHEVTVFAANVVDVWDLWWSRNGGLPDVEIINGVKVVRFHPEGGILAKTLDRWLCVKGGWRSVNYLLTPGGLELLSQGPRALAMIPGILRSKADVVASMNWYWPPAYHTYLARRFRRFPLVGIPLFHTAQPWCKRSIYDSMLASCDAVVVNTSHEGKFVKQRGATRVEVAGVGVDPNDFKRRNGDEVRARYALANFPVVGFVGRQEPQKGVFCLIEAMRRVWKWNKDVRLVLAGSGPKHDKDMVAVIGQLPESQKRCIVQVGAFDQTDKGSIFDVFDVFALPSKEESFGIAYLEAWLCGKPVIGARIGPTQCVIEDGVDGLLVDPADPEDLARAIITLLSDGDMRERMGRHGNAKTIANYTWNKVVDKIERLYLELAASKASSTGLLTAPKTTFPSVI